MSQEVYLHAELFEALQASGNDPEVIRDEFADYKDGDPFDHEWFCHDIGADPGQHLCHVHFMPCDPTAEAQWKSDFADKNKKKRRTSDRYVLYASDSRHGYLIVDILDDPGAHALWQQRRTKLATYELAATDFCTYGPKVDIHK